MKKSMKALCLLLVLALSLSLLPPRALAADNGAVTIENGSLKLSVLPDGRYAVLQKKDGSERQLSYAGKDIYGNLFGTSKTFVRINGTEYDLTEHVLRTELSGDAVVSAANIGGVLVVQTLAFADDPYTRSGEPDSVRISCGCVNLTLRAVSVQYSFLLDTQLGSNDSLPFYINGVKYFKETALPAERLSPCCLQYAPGDPSLQANTVFYEAADEKPELVRLMNFSESEPFGKTVNGMLPLADGAMSILYPAETVPAFGTGRTASFLYGCAEQDAGRQLPADSGEPVTVNILAPFRMEAKASGGYAGNPFEVSVLVTNNDASSVLTDVKAVLEFSPGVFGFAGSAGTSHSLGSIGRSGTVQTSWTLCAYSQPRYTECGFTVKISGRRGGAPFAVSKEFTIGAAADPAMKRVSFDLNYESGGEAVSAPAPQYVLKGTQLGAPEEPEREGWTFIGWYGNPNCSGECWLARGGRRGRRVQEDMTLYAGWRQKNDDFDFSRDDYRFLNSSGSFTKDHRISGEYYDYALQGENLIRKAEIKDCMKSSWNGSCFGLAAVFILCRAGQLHPDYFQPGAACLHDLERPVDNGTVRSLIEFYFVQQRSRRGQTAKQDYSRNEKENARELIMALMHSDYPVMLDIDERNGNGKRIGGHIIVAMDFTRNGNVYRVRIWDPNSHDFIYLRINSSTYEVLGFEEYNDGAADYPYFFLRHSFMLEDGDYSFKNPEKHLRELGYDSAALLEEDDGDDDFFTLTLNYEDFLLLSSDGESAEVRGGELVGSEREPERQLIDEWDIDRLNEAGAEEPLLSVRLPIRDFYTVYQSARTEEPREFVTTMMRDGGAEGFRSSASTTVPDAVMFENGGGVSFFGGGSTALSVTRNDLGTPWYTVSAERTGCGTFSLRPDGSEVLLSVDEMSFVTVAAEDDYNRVELEAAVMESGLRVAENGSGGLSLIDGGSGAILAEESMGHALIFFSLGGTPTEAQTDIPDGCCGTEPEEPQRPGFAFCGWYADPECSRRFDFSEPLTEDTRVYAGWWETEDVITHAVTFLTGETDGEGNEVRYTVLVPDGGSIDLSALPALPERNGFSAEWDRGGSFEDIRSSMTVRAVYVELPEVMALESMSEMTVEDGLASLTVFAPSDTCCIAWTAEDENGRLLGFAWRPLAFGENRSEFAVPEGSRLVRAFTADARTCEARGPERERIL